MPFTGDSFAHLFDWEKDPQRQEKIVNARLEAEFDGVDTALTTVATDLSTLEGTAVTAASAFATDNRLIKSAGTGRGTEATGISCDDSNVLGSVAGINATGNILTSLATAGQVLIRSRNLSTNTAASAEVVVQSNSGSFNLVAANNPDTTGQCGFTWTGSGALTFNSSNASGNMSFTTNAFTQRMAIASGGNIYCPGAGTTASAANAFLNSGSSPANELLRSTSSLRYKRDVETVDSAKADAVLNFRPIWYRSSIANDRQDWSWYGLAAEEVAAIDPRLVHWGYADEDREEIIEVDGILPRKVMKPKPGAEMVPDGVMYERVVVLLLDVVKRQQRTIADLESRVASIEGRSGPALTK